MEANLLIHEIDALIESISLRQIVPTREVIDTLLDWRSMLTETPVEVLA